jgi:MoaA/NifB/PqqE/SkfB family radical SAM enzyme
MHAQGSGPDVVGILLTSSCNFACRHCCNESGPARHQTLSFDEIARRIDGARDIPSVREIGFSGGEPFLFPDLLKDAVRYAAGCGFSVSVTTNGF